MWLALGGGPAAAQTVTVERLQVKSAQLKPPAADTPVLQRWTAIAPATRTRVELPRRRGGHWLRLTVDRDVAASEQRVVVMQGARAYGMVGYFPPGSERLLLLGYTREDGPMMLRRGWALPLPEGWKRGDAAYVLTKGRVPSVLNVGFLTRAELAQQRETDRRYAIAAYGAMLLMTLVVAGLWLSLREAVYLHYCGYLISVSIYTLMMSGWMKVPLSWGGLAVQYNAAPWVAATMATMFQLAFTVRFLDLPKLLPRVATLLRVIVCANLAWLAMLFIAFDHLYQTWYLGGNALFLLAIPVVIYAAIAAWRRGAEYAGYYLLGWTPLILFAGMIAAKTFGIGNTDWAERGLLLAIVLESGILMMALTQRAAARHRRALKVRPAPP
ncbi:7TM-DISM domain-containing protein [Lysobacter sp. cf310]|uniref:7TM-DISM domain-containing protein n=1 Tax=Lysobacter sp. cf310 TaxID=1761790 RepID=UPI001C31EA40|nr:7TM-DISM domain-containing protein [Lysobacter sp. cf310]